MARKFSIPPRSPDLNLIEIIFYILKNKLHLVALEMKIERKNLEEFSARVKKNPWECTSWFYEQNYSIDA